MIIWGERIGVAHILSQCHPVCISSMWKLPVHNTRLCRIARCSCTEPGLPGQHRHPLSWANPGITADVQHWLLWLCPRCAKDTCGVWEAEAPVCLHRVQTGSSGETAQQQGCVSEPALGSCQTENDTLGFLIKHNMSLSNKTSHSVWDHISSPSFSGQLLVITIKNKAVHSIEARNPLLEMSEQKKKRTVFLKSFEV